MKKVKELSTLKAIQAYTIVNNRYDEAQPSETWTPMLDGVHYVLPRIKNMPKMDQNKNMVN